MKKYFTIKKHIPKVGVAEIFIFQKILPNIFENLPVTWIYLPYNKLLVLLYFYSFYVNKLVI